MDLKRYSKSDIDEAEKRLGPIDWSRVRVDEVLKRWMDGAHSAEDEAVIRQLVVCKLCNKIGLVGGQKCPRCDGYGAVPPTTRQ